MIELGVGIAKTQHPSIVNHIVDVNYHRVNIHLSCILINRVHQNKQYIS